VLGADAQDDLAAFGKRGAKGSSGIASASIRTTGIDPRPNEPDRKFIPGEPTKPATNNVAGRS